MHLPLPRPLTHDREATVSPSRSHVRDLVIAYLERNPAEVRSLTPLLRALEAEGDPVRGSTSAGRVTCGAVVVDRERRVLHVRHEGSGTFVTPGGRVEEGDRTLAGAALRVAHEVAGIPPGALCATARFSTVPLDIAVYDVDADPAEGGAADRHYDFRFAFCLADSDADAEVSPRSGTQWRPFDGVPSPTLRVKLAGSGLDGRIEPLNASALIHDDQGRYLLHLRDDRPDIWAPGAWALLGGGREPGDGSLAETVRRELREEAGLEPAALEPFEVESATGTDGTTVPVQVFAGRWNGDAADLDLTEGVMLAWFHPETMPRLRLSPSTLELVRRHAAARPEAPSPAPTTAEQVPRAGNGSVPHIVGVHLYLEQDGKVLLGLRHPDSAYAGSTHHFLAGHCEQESAVACLVREAREEAGLRIAPEDLELAHLVHMVDEPGGRPRMGIVFRARRWEGTPVVREPDRCLSWGWWPADDLPDPVVPYARAAIEGIRAGRPYSELGWT
ncbi:NUDIX domain-containing protein [Streptomyces sp. NPDC101733]|uniref:NUDIX domain-containing protein n=1 Tax=unclassified Streptomyces TaxID=2593676 RepID=UPI003827C5EB